MTRVHRIDHKMSTGVVLEWQNLNLTIEKREFNYWKCRSNVEEKRILDNVSGCVKSGQLVAILGQSGAGKTTLLAGISQRFRGPLNGRILLNGTQIDRKKMTQISCFVPQFDITIDTLTPSEHLYFMAELKLDRRSRKNQRIDMLLRELGLRHVANNRISTLSGGERKKLNLAADLLTNPPIIFCDEPTTGLDSFNARKVIEALKYLSSTNEDISTLSTIENQSQGMELLAKSEGGNQKPAKAIICSIHQPTSETFQYFSHIILMYAGRCVFHGTTDEAIRHFSKLGYQCPTSYNPADYYLKILSDPPQDQNVESNFFEKPSEILRKSIVYKPQDVEFIDQFDANECKIQGPFWIEQAALLIQRSLLNTRRSYRELLIDLAVYLIPYIAMALLYHETTGRTQESIQDVEGALFIITCELIFTMSYSAIYIYPSQMPILRRETNDHIYSFSAYFVAEIFNVLPISILRSYIGLAITYAWAGFSMGFANYFQFALTLLITSFTANAYGLMMSGVFKFAVMEVASMFDLVFLCMSGIYINLDSMPYVRFVSPFYFSNEALSITFWSNITQIECPQQFGGQCYKNGTEVLQSLSYNTRPDGVLFDYVGLFVLGTIMHLFAFFGIRRHIRSVGYY